MVVDTEWDKEVWEAAWEKRPEEEVNEDSLRVTVKSRSRQDGSNKQAKRVKREEEGVVWGEEATESDRDRLNFLEEKSSQVAGSVQGKVKVYTGVEWMMRELVRECTHRAVELVNLTEGADQWEEWDSSSSPNCQQDGTEDPPQQPIRTRKEERYLWGMLAELDRELSRQENKEQAKKLRMIAIARKKMGVDKNQPSIFEKLTGGPCHQYGGGAPPQQINTRARDQNSQKTDPNLESANKPGASQPCQPTRCQSLLPAKSKSVR